MKPLKKTLNRRTQSSSERFWPLDLCVGILACLVICISIKRLSFDDERWLYNTWTYVISVPVSAFLLAFFSHSVINKRTQRSIQIGLLFSLLLHLLLLVLAINVVIFHQYYPRTLEASKARSPFRQRTISETILTPSRGSSDWSSPVDAVVNEKPIESENTKQLNSSAEPNRLSKPINKVIPEATRTSLAPSLQTLSGRQPMPLDEMREPRRNLNSTPVYRPTNDEPMTPKVSPASESLVGSMDRKIPESVRRVAPITSRITQPDFDAPKQERSEKINTFVELRSNQNQPSIANLNTGRTDTSKTKSLAMPTAQVASPLSVTIESVLDDKLPTSNLVPTDRTFQIRSQGQSIGKFSTSPAISNLVLPDQDAENSEASIDLESNESLPISISSPRSTRTKISISTQFSGVTNSYPSQEDSPLNKLDQRKIDLVARTNLPDTVGDLAGRRPSQPPLFTAKSPSSDADNSIGSAREIIPSQRSTQANVGPQIVMADRLPTLENLRTERSYSKLTAPRTNIAAPAMIPAPSFTQRVMRITESKPLTIPSVNPAPTQDTEDSIELGLQYLSTVQNEDGSWSLQNHGLEVILQSDTAATGLALLAYQGAGYTHQNNQYARTIERGIRFLIANQQEDGNLFRSENPISNQNVAFYSHGIAALALCEAYGMTGDVSLKDAAQRGLDFIARTQHRQRGGWRYNAQVSSDTSVTGWMMMALKSGELAGLETRTRTYQGISFWLSLAQSDESGDRYRYNPFAPDTPTQRHGRIETPTMTAVAGLMRMYTGWTRSTPELRSIADYLLQFPPTQGDNASPKRDTYYWYYATQVMFHMGGDHWKLWNEQLTPLLINSQIKDGAFKGSWDPLTPVPDRWAAHAGRIYVTTMNLLNLEVYYRHLPIYEKTGFDTNQEVNIDQ